MLIFLIVIAGLSLLVLGHEAGHFAAAKLFGLKVDEFGFGFPPRIFSWRPRRKRDGIPRQARDDTVYSVNWLPFGGFVKIAGEKEAAQGLETLKTLSLEEKKRYFSFQPAWKRFVVIVAGVAVNFLIGWLLISFVFMVGVSPALVVAGVQPDSPAEKVGIREGDILKNYTQSDDFINFINQNRGKPITVEIIRGDKEISFSVTPRNTTPPGQGALGAYLGERDIKRQTILNSFRNGFSESILIAQSTLIAFYGLFKDILLYGSLSPDIVGPVGIVGIAKETAHVGLIYFLRTIAFVSINLAVINLIPLPPFDGGWLFKVIFEMVRGSAPSATIHAWINKIGFAFLVFLIILIILITPRDIARWF